MTARVAAVVIHHRRYPEVLGTVRSLVEAGIDAGRIVVVDNSEDPGIAQALAADSTGWRLHTMPNRGYGAAANAALPLLPPAEVVLVVTHEVRIDEASVAALVRVVTEEPKVGAAGPGLLIGDEAQVWSRGGRLTRSLRLPRQLVHDPAESGPVRDVDWLDGACVAYRAEVLAENPFREDFFMYFEETELHTRLRESGWRVVAVDGASASQSTGGMPTYWGCRNVVLFQQAHGSRWSRVVAPPYFTSRMMVIAGLAGDVSGLLAAPRGLVAGYRHERRGA